MNGCILVGYTKPCYLNQDHLAGWPMTKEKDNEYCVPLYTRNQIMPTFKVFQTKEKAKQYAIEQYGSLEVETECVNVIKIGPQIAKHLGCNKGYAVDKEVETETE